MTALYKIGQRLELDPAGLVPLPAVAAMHRCAKGSDEFQRRCASFRERGQIDDIQITEFGEVIDGETTRQICLAIGLKVWARVFPKTDWLGVAVDSMMMSRDWNGYQRAFGLYPLFEAEMKAKDEAAGAVFNACPADKADTSKTFESILTRVGEMAHKLRVSPEYMRLAHRLHTVFAEDGEERYLLGSWDAQKRLHELDWDLQKTYTLREYYTACILELDSPMYLSEALKGAMEMRRVRLEALQGKPHGGRHTINQEKQLTLWNRVVTDTVTRWESWQKFDDKLRAQHFEFVSSQAALMNEQQRTELESYHKRMARIFKVKKPTKKKKHG